MSSKEVRESFLKYFETQSHKIVPSSSVIPKDDPSLLFINAGMNQFKDIFLGKTKAPYSSATTSQKCIRVGGKHNDLENVGHTKRHVTFFEMLGNFSFGDYFKEKAIAFAFDVSTHIFGFDLEKIWVSVFKDDDEAYELWKKYIPEKRIVRLGEKDNFWSMGETGPCGPCSELLYDRGEKYSDANNPYEDLSGERFLEFWNLVFMQYNRHENGKMTPLPNPCIDTGAGLERVMALKMDVNTVFETDILRGIIAKIENLSKIKYNTENHILTPAFNVIADHLRTLSFAIADGAIPSNVDRGYVLRKILRRAVRYSKRLGFKKPFLAKLVPTLISEMGDAYIELKKAEKYISEILTIEEENFHRVLKRGGNILNDIIDHSKERISAKDAFKLKDTYGFPIEEILLIAKDAMLDVDLKGFNDLENEAKEKSKKAHKTVLEKFDKNIFTDFVKVHKKTLFEGYEKDQIDTKIVAILKENKFSDEIKIDESGMIILEKTPFYPEKGGQIGDFGKIYFGENIFKVEKTFEPYSGIIAHSGKLLSGKLSKNEKVHAKINKEKRINISANHSATHLLHHSLIKVLGSHIKQAGSYVDDKRMRFDFSHHKSLSYEEIKKIEFLVNAEIRKNYNIKTNVTTLEEVQKDKDIIQIFDEKYEKEVRVVEIGPSKELCGGCHTSMTGNIGFFKIIKESSIAAGVRRIEAVTGEIAENFVYEKQEFITYIADLLKTKEGKIIENLEGLLSEHIELNKILKKLKQNQLSSLKEDLLNDIEKIKDIKLIMKKVNIDSSDLNSFSKELLDKIKSGIIILANEKDGKSQMIVRISPDIAEKGIFANDLIKKACEFIDGKGGGKLHFAQGGGTNSKNIEKAFETIYLLIKEKC